jgi:hypothetical protein
MYKAWARAQKKRSGEICKNQFLKRSIPPRHLWSPPKTFFLSRFSIFSNIFRSTCRMVTILLPFQRARLSAPFKYLPRYHRTLRKYSRDLWKKVYPQNQPISENEAWKSARIFCQKLMKNRVFKRKLDFKCHKKLFHGSYEHVQGI